MNVYDSRVIASILSENGYKEINDEKNADVIIVNTCSVREHAEQRAIGRIGDLQKFRKENPNLLIGVVGCMAENQSLKAEKSKSLKGVDFMVGPSNYRELPKIIENRKWKMENGKTDELYSDIFPEPEKLDGLVRVPDFIGTPIPLYNSSAFVPVMRGCDNFCSYCIVPYVRGRARSRPTKDILKEIELLASKGIKEITLLGQSVNEYSYDGVSFPHLLRLIDRISHKIWWSGDYHLSEDSVPWIKFMTSHPKNMSQELIDIVRDGKKICEWIHLPMQSGANEILENMGREYTKKEYLDWIYKIRSAIPEVSITTDIMVGFPGESETHFQETIKVVKEIRFDFAYMFKYSERPRTRAYNMLPEVSELTKSERLAKLINIQNKITREKNSELIGTVQEVLVLGKSKRPVQMHNVSGGNSLYGRTRQNKMVVFDGKASPGDFVKVKIKGLRGWTLHGDPEMKAQTDFCQEKNKPRITRIPTN